MALVVVLGAGCSKPRNQNLLDQHRNLGKAFYENPTTQQQAVAEFQQALQIAPDSARDKLNYALALLKMQGREEEAIKLLQEVQRQDPTLAHTWFNLGIYYKHQGDTKQAIEQFVHYLRNERNVSPHTLREYRRDVERNQYGECGRRSIVRSCKRARQFGRVISRSRSIRRRHRSEWCDADPRATGL